MDNSSLFGKTVLLINDNPIQLGIFRSFLEKANCRVHSFLDSAEALTFAISMPKCDVVVTDLYMPNIDGWRVCRLLRSQDIPNFNKVPILVTSATFSGVEAESITQELGANAFVNVPITHDEFFSVLDQVVDGQRHIRKRKVIVIEDDPVQQRILERTFEKHDFNVATANTGQDALILTSEMSPNIAILDYHLPDVDGDVLIQKLQEITPHLIVIVITADNQPEKSVEMLQKGAFSYIVKPFAPEFLMELCEIALREKALLMVEDLLESRTQEALRNERNYRLLIDSIPTGVFEVDVNGKIVFVSSQWQRLTGLDQKEVQNKPWFDFLCSEEPALAKDQWNQNIKSECFSKKTTWKWQLPHGEIGWFDISFSKRDQEQLSADQPVFIGILEDVSEKKRIEDLKEREKLRAFHAHKMISLGELSAGVAHEINNPLTIALGQGQKILKNWVSLISQPEKMKSNISKIVQSCERIAKTVSSLRTLSGAEESTAPVPLLMSDVVQSTAKFYSEKMSTNNITFDISYEDPDAKILGHASELSQVLINLFDNAIYFLDESQTNKLVSVECLSHGNEVEVLFSDNGIGITKKNKEKIFEPFFTTKPPVDGAGLGLSIALSIIEHHEGRFELKCEKKPTVFSIKIPLAAKIN